MAVMIEMPMPNSCNDCKLLIPLSVGDEFFCPYINAKYPGKQIIKDIRYRDSRCPLKIVPDGKPTEDEKQPIPMELRDWFAGMALAGMSANEWAGDKWELKLSHTAYRIADAMLEVRQKK